MDPVQGEVEVVCSETCNAGEEKLLILNMVCLPISKLFFELFFAENYFFRTSSEHDSYEHVMPQQCVNIKYHTPLLISNLTSKVLSLNCIVRNSRKLLKTKLYES